MLFSMLQIFFFLFVNLVLLYYRAVTFSWQYFVQLTIHRSDVSAFLNFVTPDIIKSTAVILVGGENNVAVSNCNFIIYAMDHETASIKWCSGEVEMSVSATTDTAAT